MIDNRKMQIQIVTMSLACLLFSLHTHATVLDERAALLTGVTQFSVPEGGIVQSALSSEDFEGINGGIPLIQGDGVWFTFAAKTMNGNGKVFFIGHNTFYSTSRWSTAQTQLFFNNIFIWFVNGKSTLQIGHLGGTFVAADLENILSLTAGSVTITDLDPLDLATHDLSVYDLITLNFANIAKDYTKVVNYLNNGGNVFMAFNFWAYGDENVPFCVEKLVLEDCCNLSLNKDRNSWALYDPDVVLPVVSATEDEVKTYLRGFSTEFVTGAPFEPTTLQKDTKEKMRYVIPMVTKANIVAWKTTDNAGDPLLLTTIFANFEASNYRPSGTTAITNSHQTRIIFEIVLSLGKKVCHPFAHASDYPGDVTETTAETDFIYDAPSSHQARDGFFFSGLYAKAGESVTFEITENTDNLSVYADISIKNDYLTDRIGKEMKRFPSMGSSFKVKNSGTSTLCDPHGGLIFFTFSKKLAADKSLKIKINGAYKAPYYRHSSATAAADWQAVRAKGIPWTVVECNQQAFIQQSTTYTKALNNPGIVCPFWDTSFDDISDFSGDFRTALQWYQADRTISIGYMHSGNPIATHDDVNDYIIGAPASGSNTTTILTEPSWGFYHEIGHNYQSGLWTWSWTIQVTVNVFSLRLVYQNFGLMPLSAPWMGDAAAFYTAYNAAPAFDNSDARQILFSYAEIIQNIGWAFMQRVFAYYQSEMPLADKPADNDESKIKRWMITVCDLAGYNLIPRFRYWKWPYVNQVQPFVSKYNDWNNDKNITTTWPGGLKVIVPVVFSESELFPLNNPSWTVTQTVGGVSTTIVCVQATGVERLVVQKDCLLQVNQDASQTAGKVIIQFTSINVAGKLTFVSSLNDILIQTQSLNLIDGNLELGSPTSPYTGKFRVELRGTSTDPSLADFDVGYPVGNQVIAVGGEFLIYGPTTAVPFTRLFASANAGAIEILVVSSTGWRVGDQIAVSPSGGDPSQYEKFTITSIAAEGGAFQIGLNVALSHFHFGASSVTLSQTFENSTQQTLDLRAIVILLTRDIQIYGTEQDQWGGRISVYNQGRLILQGVELANMGQRDSQLAGVEINEDFRTLYNSEETTVISKSSIHDCNGICFRAYRSAGFNILDSAFLRAHPIFVDLYQNRNFTIQRNVFVSALNRPSYNPAQEPYDVKAFIFLNFTNYTNYTQQYIRKLDTDGLILDNAGHGSDGLGFAFPSFDCQEKAQIISREKGIFNNEAVGAKIGVLFFPIINSPVCTWAGGFSVGLSEKGLQYAANSTAEYQLEYVISAQNKQSISLKQTSHLLKSAFKTTFNRAIVASVLRTNCASCFSTTLKSNQFCNQNIGLLTLTPVIWTGNYSLLNDPLNETDFVTNHTSIASTATLNNITFLNFKTNYASLPSCGKSSAISTNPTASDYTPPHNLLNSKCVECEKTALLYFNLPKSQWLGLGGCGSSQCTGLNNIIINDRSGGFFNPTTGIVMQGVSNNPDFSNYISDKCEKIPEWNNGLLCQDEQITVFNFEDTDPAYGKIYENIQIIDDQTNQTINSFSSMREYDYFKNGTAKQERKNQFGSISMLKTKFQIKFPLRPPRQQIFSMKSFASNQGWVNPSITYLEPLSLTIVNRGAPSTPRANIYVQDAEQSQFDLSKTPECGKHNYFLKNNSLSFILTGGDNCNLEILQVSSLFLTAGIPANLQEFLSDNKSVSFILRVCAFLNISSTQLRIVGFNTPQNTTNTTGSATRRDIRRLRGLQEQEQQTISDLSILLDEPLDLEQGSNSTSANSTTRRRLQQSTQPMTQEQKKKYLIEKGNLLSEGVQNNTLDAGFPIKSLQIQLRMVPQKPQETFNQTAADLEQGVQFEEIQNQVLVSTPVEEESQGISPSVIAVAVIIPILVVAILVIAVLLYLQKKRESSQIQSTQKKINYQNLHQTETPQDQKKQSEFHRRIGSSDEPASNLIQQNEQLSDNQHNEKDQNEINNQIIVENQ